MTNEHLNFTKMVLLSIGLCLFIFFKMNYGILAITLGIHAAICGYQLKVNNIPNTPSATVEWRFTMIASVVLIGFLLYEFLTK